MELLYESGKVTSHEFRVLVERGPHTSKKKRLVRGQLIPAFRLVRRTCNNTRTDWMKNLLKESFAVLLFSSHQPWADLFHCWPPSLNFLMQKGGHRIIQIFQ